MELHYLRLHRELPCLTGTNGMQEKLPCQKCLGVYFHNQLYPYYCWSSEQSVYYTYQHTMLRSKGRLKCSGLNLPSPGGCGYYCTVSCCHTFVLYLVSLQHKWVCDCEDQWRFWFLLVQTVSLKSQHFLLQYCQFWLLLQLATIPTIFSEIQKKSAQNATNQRRHWRRSVTMCPIFLLAQFWHHFNVLMMISPIWRLYYQLAQQRETLSYKIKLNHVSQQTVLNLS